MNNDPTNGHQAIGRIVFGTFGFAFAGIGLTVLGFLWGSPFGQFRSPPLFFRIFGSFIALVFVVMGGSTLFAAIVSGGLGNQSLPLDMTNSDANPVDSATGSGLNYSCSNCGAQLSNKSDVSPLGDVKCSFCHQWFNIHRANAKT